MNTRFTKKANDMVIHLIMILAFIICLYIAKDYTLANTLLLRVGLFVELNLINAYVAWGRWH